MYFSNLNSIMECLGTSVRDKPQRKMHLPCSAWANCIKYSLFMEIDGLVRFTSVFVVIFLHAIHLTTIDEPWQWALNQVWHRLQATRRCGRKEGTKIWRGRKKIMSWTCVRQCHAEMRSAERKESRDEKTNKTLHVIIEIVYWKKQLFRFIHRQQSFHSLSLPIASFTWCSHRCLAEY